MTTNLTNRFTALMQVASPDLLQDTAAALLGVANAEGYAASGEGRCLATVAAEMRSMAFEKMTGVGK